MDLEALHGLTLEEIYGPRRVDFLGVWELNGWQLKVYGIPFNREAVRSELVEAAQGAARRSLPRLDEEGGDWTGVGFVVVHDSEDGGWVLVDWWGMSIVLFQEIYYSGLDALAELAKADQRMTACVYELAVVDFERRLWLELMRDDPRSPSTGRYLRGTMTGEV